MRVLWDEFRWSPAGSDGEVVKKIWGLQTCFISHQGTWVHSSPADRDKTFFQGVVLVQLLNQGGFIQVQ